MNKYILLIISVFLFLISAFGKSYHVSLKGNDVNTGTLKSPFHSIQKAADIMQDGDTCYIHAGTYYESVRPVSSGVEARPIVFTAYHNDEVIVHGGRIVNNWTKYKENIYKATIPDTVKDLFVNRQYMLLARHPNMPYDPSKGFDMLHPALGTANPPANIDWTNVTVIQSDKHGWRNRIWNQDTYLELPDSIDRGGWLMGIPGLLDSEGEWYWKDGVLYLWLPKGKKPESLLVEAKVRDCGFDLSGRNNIILNKLTVFGSTINMYGASHCMMDGCKAFYVGSMFKNSKFFISGFWSPMSADITGKGILMGGSSNTIQNCEIAHSWGNCVSILGSNNTVFNCEIYDANWQGDECAVILMNGGGHIIKRNKLHDSTREIVMLQNLMTMNPVPAAPCHIELNELYNAGTAKTDNGAFYTFCTDGNRTVIAYNWIHDCFNGYDEKLHGGAGIYLDDYSKNYIVHHNVIWNVTNGPWATGIFANNPKKDYEAGPNNHRIYNNTIWNCKRAVNSPEKDWNGSAASRFWSETEVFNNILLKDITFAKAAVKNNYSGTIPVFTDTLNHDFRLGEGSPCIDAGKVIPGITDSFKGSAPDIGAYEYGGEYWLPGLLPGNNDKVSKADKTTRK